MVNAHCNPLIRPFFIQPATIFLLPIGLKKKQDSNTSINSALAKNIITRFHVWWSFVLLYFCILHFCMFYCFFCMLAWRGCNLCFLVFLYFMFSYFSIFFVFICILVFCILLFCIIVSLYLCILYFCEFAGVEEGGHWFPISAFLPPRNPLHQSHPLPPSFNICQASILMQKYIYLDTSILTNKYKYLLQIYWHSYKYETIYQNNPLHQSHPLPPSFNICQASILKYI